MLVCLACPKQAHLPPTHDDHHPHAALGKSSAVLGPSKEHMKSFTTQLKDIVMKFSSGAYRHCRPCTAAAVRGGVADEDDHNGLYAEDDEKSSILVGSNSEYQAMSDHVRRSLLHEDEYGVPHRLGDSSPTSSRYDLLPMARSKRRHHRHKKRNTSSATSSSTSTLTLKQLPSNPESCDAIEQLLNAHFQREQMILAEEQLAVIRDDEQLLDVENRGDLQLLEEAQLVSSREHQIEEHVDDDDDGHVKRSKRHMNAESSGNFEEWVAHVEPGVMITFVALPDGSNHLKRIRFSRELFSKWQAQLWWAENSDMVRELYSVSKSEAPFKSCSSARSSSSTSSTTSSSHDHHHALLNTPELQSRVGSSQSSPSHAHLIIDAVENKAHLTPEPSSPRAHLSPKPSSPSISLLPMSHSLGSLSHAMVDRHDNPLYDSPEFEMCYHEGVKGPLIVQRILWASVVEGHTQPLQQDANDDDGGDDPNGELVRELKRVRFITQSSSSKGEHASLASPHAS